MALDAQYNHVFYVYFIDIILTIAFLLHDVYLQDRTTEWWALMCLALVNGRLGNNDKARRTLQQAAQLGPQLVCSFVCSFACRCRYIYPPSF